MGGRGVGVDAAIAAGREDHALGAEAVQRAVIQLPCRHAAARAILHDQVEREVLDEEVDRVFQRLAVERVKDGVAGAVGRSASALDRGLAIVAGHAAKGPLIDLAFFCPGEGHAPVLELVDGGRRRADHVFDGVLVAKPVGALHGVVHVPAPVILAHVAQRCRDAALRRHGMRAGGEDLGDAGRAQAGLRTSQRRTKPGAAGADHHDVIGVIVPGVGGHVVTSQNRRGLEASRIRWRSREPRRRPRRTAQCRRTS